MAQIANAVIEIRPDLELRIGVLADRAVPIGERSIAGIIKLLIVEIRGAKIQVAQRTRPISQQVVEGERLGIGLEEPVAGGHAKLRFGVGREDETSGHALGRS